MRLHFAAVDQRSDRNAGVNLCWAPELPIVLLSSQSLAHPVLPTSNGLGNHW
jgi:hypothetical protein